MEVTLEQIKKITGISDITKLNLFSDGLNSVITKYQINTPNRLAHFLAQIKHESNNFTAVVENLNYSAKALIATWPKRFTKEQAEKYQRNQIKIGNIAYGGRMGNGDIESGDGYKFRGRAYLQITGKDNYKAIGKALGLDLIKNPELLENSKYALEASAWWWNSRNLNKIADQSGDDIVEKITKVINGGFNGLSERKENYEKIMLILK